MTAGGKKSTPFSEKIITILLCKGDLSDEEIEIDPCSTMELFRFASTRHKVCFTIGLLCTALTGLLMPLNQILGGLVAEAYLQQPNAEGNDSVLAAVMVVQYLLLTVTNEIVDRLRGEYVAAVLRLDAESLDATSPGKLSAELNENIDKIRDGLGEKFALVIRSTCIFLSSIIAAFVYNWKVSLVLLPLGPIGAVVTGLSGRFTARSIKRQMDTSSKGASLVEESVMNVKTVAACNGQEDMVKKYRSILDDLIVLGSRVCLLNGFFEGLLFFCIYFFALFSLLVGVPDTFSEGGLDGGSVIIAFGSILLGAYFLGLLGPHMMTLLKARMAAAVIYQTIDKATTMDAPSDAKVQRLRGEIEFRDVRFKYASRDAMVLQGLSWSARAGQAVAFAGHSGCGKSTSIGLLTKLYEKCAGEITVDGKDIAQYDRQTIRKNIGMVAQEPCLFNGTIRENILLGRGWDGKGTSEQRLREVATIAQAWNFIEKLEHGFDTILGEGGIALSGGQKQRIAISRAIFTDPPILILDEATSALDVQSERLVQAALNDASIGRTTISIAHRLSTLKEMDVIYVVDRGVVIEQGTHDALLSKDGTYSKMAELQNLGVDENRAKTSEDPAKEVFQRVRSRRSSRMSSKIHPLQEKEKQYFFSSKASESVIATIKERILSRVLHRNAEYFDHPETSNATIVNDLNQQPTALLAGLDGRAVLFVWCSTCITTCNIAALLALEIFSQTRTIQIMAVEKYFGHNYARSQEEVEGNQRKSVIVQALIFSISNGSIYLFGLVSFGFGAHFVYHGLLTGQELYLVGMTVEFSAWALSFVNPTFPDLVRANAAARILYSYFDLPEPVDAGDAQTELKGTFEVQNVSFAYPTRPHQTVAKQLCISAAAGDSIALVGPSGCGKSTLISLFERFYDQQEGTIKFDSIDHRSMAVRHLRTQVALVGQEPVLFEGSIAENILLGCSGCSIDDVRDACKMSNAANFIEDLPEGYDTDVGSKGRSLSGGQKQRIAIARALVRKPKILLLDEATSALDGESERIVQEAIARASEGRTSISIAHRLATIKDVTRIYFIEDGSVVESGNHEELVDLRGKYASYVKAQSLASS
ncbi:hypothetical protein PMAYCL1PPCAC_16854 [Pristionchus mayeri]|uniref:ABC transporter ATP-binding protein n=1 Tax=Pristionchus mayeri TaxID=1317129 RepID=A0AAN5CLQ3_9BILA|nr:hypothetical protein PMAYCL1PPCAC_16854 [Pristionchus mayeri]